MPPRQTRRDVGRLEARLKARRERHPVLLRGARPAGRDGARAQRQAAERLVVATLACERAGEPGEVADRLAAPILGVGVVDVDPAEQPGQRADVLVVVADDVDERPGLAAPQEVEVEARDLPAVDVGVAIDPSSSVSTVWSRASAIRWRNTRRTNGRRSRWPAWSGAGSRAIR